MKQFFQNPVSQRFVRGFEFIKKGSFIKTNAELARKIGISPQSLNAVLKGRRDLTIDHIAKCFTNLGVNPVFFFADLSEKKIFDSLSIQDFALQNDNKPANIGQNETPHFTDKSQIENVDLNVDLSVDPLPKKQNETPQKNLLDVTTDAFSTKQSLLNELENLRQSNALKDQTIAALQRAVEAYEQAEKWRNLHDAIVKSQAENTKSA